MLSITYIAIRQLSNETFTYICIYRYIFKYFFKNYSIGLAEFHVKKFSTHMDIQSPRCQLNQYAYFLMHSCIFFEFNAIDSLVYIYTNFQVFNAPRHGVLWKLEFLFWASMISYHHWLGKKALLILLLLWSQYFNWSVSPMEFYQLNILQNWRKSPAWCKSC